MEIFPTENVEYWFGMPSNTTHYAIEGYAKRSTTGTDGIRVGANATAEEDYPDRTDLLIPGRRTVAINNR